GPQQRTSPLRRRAPREVSRSSAWVDSARRVSPALRAYPRADVHQKLVTIGSKPLLKMRSLTATVQLLICDVVCVDVSVIVALRCAGVWPRGTIGRISLNPAIWKPLPGIANENVCTGTSAGP